MCVSMIHGGKKSSRSWDHSNYWTNNKISMTSRFTATVTGLTGLTLIQIYPDHYPYATHGAGIFTNIYPINGPVL